MKNANEMITAALLVVFVIVILAINLAVPIWKYKTCKAEGLSTKYCVSRLF